MPSAASTSFDHAFSAAMLLHTPTCTTFDRQGVHLAVWKAARTATGAAAVPSDLARILIRSQSLYRVGWHTHFQSDLRQQRSHIGLKSANQNSMSAKHIPLLLKLGKGFKVHQ